MKRECVQHFVAGRDAWQVGPLGFWMRWRGKTVVFLATTIITGGIPWWWPKEIAVTLDLRGLLAIITGLLGALVFAGFQYLRARSERSLEIKYCIHALAHFARDSYSEYSKDILRGAALPSYQENKNFRAFINGLCGHVGDYFKTLTSDKTVGVAIRLAIKCDNITEPSGIAYRTIGRWGLNPAREATSEDIPASDGIPRYLSKEMNSQGILVYNDVPGAIGLKLFKKTENEELFPKEIKSMMVAPLNAWEGEKHTMIGLLYLTSSGDTTFSVKHVDDTRFAADIVAQAVAAVVDKLTRHSRMPSLRRE